MGKFVPTGSYTQTSRNISVDLYAQAQKRDQSWVDAHLNETDLNQANVANLDGFLVNESGDATSSGYTAGGSYTITSRNITVILSAEAQKRDQSWQWSTLDLTNLNNVQIENIDGELRVV